MIVHVPVGLDQHAHKLLVLQQTHQHACVAPKFVQIPQVGFATKMEINAPSMSFRCAKLWTVPQKMRTTVPADQLSVMPLKDCFAWQRQTNVAQLLCALS